MEERGDRRKPLVKDIRIYFEGDDRLRPGFRGFFSVVIEAARKQKRSVFPIATNGTPVKAFSIAQKKHTDSLNLLLLDSEHPLDGTGVAAA